MSTATETLYAPLTIATAPDTSKPYLEKIQKANGFVPNLMAIFANNPVVLEGYLALDAAYEKGRSLQGSGSSFCSLPVSRTIATTAPPRIRPS